MRTAAIVIDNFLSNDKWIYIQNNLSQFMNSSEFIENRETPYPKTLRWIKSELQRIHIWQEHWNLMFDSYSYINSCPPNIDRESSGGNGGFHKEFGGFVYYVHPTWNSSWGGHLKFKDCDVSKIEPKPNRFVWINPAIWHGIEVVNSNATHNRITIVGWPEGCVEYSAASQRINSNK